MRRAGPCFWALFSVVPSLRDPILFLGLGPNTHVHPSNGKSGLCRGPRLTCWALTLRASGPDLQAEGRRSDQESSGADSSFVNSLVGMTRSETLIRQRLTVCPNPGSMVFILLQKPEIFVFSAVI